MGSCTDGEATKTMNVLSDSATFDTFAVLQSLECSTMGRPMIEQVASENLDATREYGVAQEFLTGAATDNPSLAQAEIFGVGAADATTALACLDGAVNSELYGRLGFIHVPPTVATHLLAAGAIYNPGGNRWYTASGNVVIISPGYDGRRPGSGQPITGEALYMYATGEVYAQTGQRENLAAYERTQNSLQAIAEEVALVVFDPCFNIAIDSGVNACEVVS